jgi:hypothetical protein
VVHEFAALARGHDVGKSAVGDLFRNAEFANGFPVFQAGAAVSAIGSRADAPSQIADVWE